MANVKIVKLLPLLMVPYFLLICQVLINRADANTHNIINQQISASTDANITELKQAYNELNISIETLIQQLQEVVEKKRDKNSIDVRNLNKNLNQLRQANQILVNKHISSNINTAISDIAQITEPLANGLTEKNVAQIQNFLRLPDQDSSVKKYLGRFGKITQTAIQKFLTEQNQKLATNIQNLEKISQSDVDNNQQPANLEIENEQLRIKIETLHWKYNLYVIAAFVTGIFLGVMVIVLYQKIRNKDISEEQNSFVNPEIKQPTYTENIYLQNNISQPIVEEIEPIPETQKNPPNWPIQNPVNSQAVTNNRSITRIISNASVNELITIYNQNRNSLSKYSTEVSETEESINQRRLGSHQTAILEKVSKGKGSYWIINKQGIDYLVPKGNIKINEYNYKTVESLFDCQGYQSGVSSNFNLVKPAQVTLVSQEMWQVVDYGVLKF